MDMSQSACFQTLGLPENAPISDVRRAYRRLARRLHPDIAGGDSTRFTEITAAYNVLTGRSAAARAHTETTTAGPARSAADEAEHARAYAEFRRRASAWRPSNGGRGPQPQAAPVAPVAGSSGAPTESPTPRITPVAPAAHATSNASEAAKPSLWQRLRSKLRRAAPTQGRDVYLTMPLDALTVLHGGEHAIQIQRAAACPSCVGGGEDRKSVV